jgi:hypothetical protein
MRQNEIEIFKHENNNEYDCYVSEEDEDFILNDSGLDDESDSESSELNDESDNSSSDDEAPLDKNGKRGTCRGTEDEAEDDDDEEEEEEEEKEESDDKTDSKVAQEVRKILNSLDLTPKTLRAKRKKATRSLQQNKIMLLSKVSRNLFTFDGANNIQSDDSDDSDSSIYFLIFKTLLTYNNVFFIFKRPRQLAKRKKTPLKS